MAFIETWDEAKPSGSRDRSLGDDDIREFKRAIRERIAVDHEMESDESGHSDIGYHKAVHLGAQASDPTPVTGYGIVYTKTISGIVELFYEDGAGTVKQLTTNGKLNIESAEGVVLLTGDQTIAGTKTFSSAPAIAGFTLSANGDCNNKQLTNMIIENRTDDTGCTTTGRMWFRTDV